MDQQAFQVAAVSEMKSKVFVMIIRNIFFPKLTGFDILYIFSSFEIFKICWWI